MDKSERIFMVGMVFFWVAACLASLGFLGVLVWGVIRLVTWVVAK